MANHMDIKGPLRVTEIGRRSFLKGITAAAASLGVTGVTGCLGPRPALRVVPSRRPIPKPFQARLRFAPVLHPQMGVDGIARLVLAAKEGSIGIFPDTPTQVRGYAGIFPGPTIIAERGQRVMLLLINQLPHPIVNHLHGGHTPASSDGFPTDLIHPLPEGVQIPDLTNVIPGTSGTGWQAFDYPNEQRETLLWYHDHRMDYTGSQVWHGLVGTYLLQSEQESRLNLPSGERELILVLCDRSFDASGQLHYPVSGDDQMLDARYMGGVLGDVQLVNGIPWPVHPVATGQYRLRILNASNARTYQLELDRSMPVGYQFAQIGSDGGLLNRPVLRRTVHLAPAERVDLLVDFAGCAPNKPVHLLNTSESGDLGHILRFVPIQQVTEPGIVPSILSEDLPPALHAGLTERNFEFKYNRIKKLWTVNGQSYDPTKVIARPQLGSTEIWHLRTDFTHPLHIHLVHFAIISHAGRIPINDHGWKDTISMVAGETATILIPFHGHRGKYVFHCHNLEHEDMRMMANFEVV